MQNSKQSAVLTAGHAESSSSGTVPCKAGRFKKPAALLGPYPRCKRQEEPLQTDLSTLDAIQEMVASDLFSKANVQNRLSLMKTLQGLHGFGWAEMAFYLCSRDRSLTIIVSAVEKDLFVFNAGVAGSSPAPKIHYTYFGHVVALR